MSQWRGGRGHKVDADELHHAILKTFDVIFWYLLLQTILQ
jgi:hypothetical protein